MDPRMSGNVRPATIHDVCDPWYADFMSHDLCRVHVRIFVESETPSCVQAILFASTFIHLHIRRNSAEPAFQPCSTRANYSEKLSNRYSGALSGTTKPNAVGSVVDEFSDYPLTDMGSRLNGTNRYQHQGQRNTYLSKTSRVYCEV
jgi:hypothetical protein